MKNWYNLNTELIEYIIPRLEEFREKNVNSHPVRYPDIDSWHKDIDEMLYCLRETRDETESERLYKEYVSGKMTEQEFAMECEKISQRVTRGLELFGRSIPDLWD